jgi:acyl carrier protein/D-alanine--poly(phosphoribitol) ligase subunit 2
MSAIKDEILEFIKEEYLEDDDEVDINSQSPLISSGIVDSFSMVSLKRHLEQKFNITIPNAKATAEAFDSVDNIMNLLAELNIK